MREMLKFKVLAKEQRKDPWSDGTHLVLKVQRAGAKVEDRTVSGVTFDAAKIGEEIELPR